MADLPTLRALPRRLPLQISVDEDFQVLGLGNQLITETLATASAADGCTWVTTTQNDTATGFWRGVGRRRVSFAEAEGNRAPCPDMGEPPADEP